MLPPPAAVSNSKTRKKWQRWAVESAGSDSDAEYDRDAPNEGRGRAVLVQVFDAKLPSSVGQILRGVVPAERFAHLCTGRTQGRPLRFCPGHEEV